MQTIVNLQQTRLFDPFDSVLTEKVRKRLLDGWPGVFRHVILELMPVDAIAGRFHPRMGRPTKECYKTRGGIEGTNSGLKRGVGLGRLRVRGRPAVFHAIYLKIAGWNILRASVCAKMREIVYERANMATFCLVMVILRGRFVDQTTRRRPSDAFSVGLRQYAEFSRFHIAA